MRRRLHKAPRLVWIIPVLLLCTSVCLTGAARRKSSLYALNTIEGLEVINTKASAAKYLGKNAVRLLDLPGQAKDDVAGGNTIAVIAGTDFSEGTIDVDVAGAPREGATEGARGFIGIAFHVQEQRNRFECFYLRPTNGRADDQLRRNHSVQYIAEPDFPWPRMRSEFPGVYESYADIQPGVWTHLKIEVSAGKARLYINGAKEPTLIVNDMKHAATHGPVALWIGQDTDGYFSSLKIQ